MPGFRQKLYRQQKNIGKFRRNELFCPLTLLREASMFRPSNSEQFFGVCTMKVINSLKSAKKRHRDCRVVRRKGRVYVINKTNPRFKARQG